MSRLSRPVRRTSAPLEPSGSQLRKIRMVVLLGGQGFAGAPVSGSNLYETPGGDFIRRPP
jgi:hypothetical protein